MDIIDVAGGTGALSSFSLSFSSLPFLLLLIFLGLLLVGDIAFRIVNRIRSSPTYFPRTKVLLSSWTICSPSSLLHEVLKQATGLQSPDL